MKSRDFVFWLVGYLETVAPQEGAKLDVEQVATIKSRLSSCLVSGAAMAEGELAISKNHCELSAIVDKGHVLNFHEVANRFLGSGVVVQED